MKRFFALLFAASLLLVGCAAPTDENGLSVAKAAAPDLPEAPSWAEFEKAVSKLDAKKLGDEKYSEEWDKLWNEYEAKEKAYREAITALRGEGIDTAYTRSFADYTRTTARTLLPGGTETVVYSPANLYLALCMLAETAEGDSRAQLLSLLELESTDDARTVSSALWRNLYEDNEDGRTHLGSSLWLSDGVPFAQETVDTLAQEYYADTFSAPMGKASTDKAIQSWLNEATGGLLKDATAGVATDPNTVMLLLTTLYFQARWSTEFSASRTQEDTFTNADGSETRIDFMHITDENHNCTLGENYAVASRYFRDGKRMTFLLPDEGTALDDVLANDGAMAALLGLAEDNARADLIWSVPKFDVTDELDLSMALRVLGVEDVFDAGRADFSPLTDADVFVSRVHHAARVKLDEEGCEGAAFTDIAICSADMPVEQPKVELRLDRPFAFVISGADGLPLFFGAVKNL